MGLPLAVNASGDGLCVSGAAAWWDAAQRGFWARNRAMLRRQQACCHWTKLEPQVERGYERVGCETSGLGERERPWPAGREGAGGVEGREGRGRTGAARGG